jgi:hypothetical protein
MSDKELSCSWGQRNLTVRQGEMSIPIRYISFLVLTLTIEQAPAPMLGLHRRPRLSVSGRMLTTVHRPNRIWQRPAKLITAKLKSANIRDARRVG